MNFRFSIGQVVNIIDEGWELPIGYGKIINRRRTKKSTGSYSHYVNYYMLDNGETKEEEQLQERELGK